MIFGGVAQLGEHLLCKQGVIGSIPFTSTNTFAAVWSLLDAIRKALFLKGAWRFAHLSVRLFFNNLEEVD
jgi:hypothetical protein